MSHALRPRARRYTATQWCAFGLLSSAIGLAGCNSSSAQLTPASNSIRIGIPQVGASGAPLSAFAAAVRLMTAEGLTSTERDGRPVPRLAESWKESGDGLQWTISLRPNVLYHDGTALTPQDVKASILTVRTSYPGLRDVTAVDVTGPHEITVRLAAPSSLLLEDLYTSIFKRGGRVATGPFRVSAQSADEATLDAFAQYHGQVPQLQHLTMKGYPTLRLAFVALLRGDIDAVYDVGQEGYEFVQNESSVQVYSYVRPFVSVVAFNSGVQKFQSPRVRQALNYAIDRPALVRSGFRDRARVAGTGLWPNHWAFDRRFAGFSYDPERAIALLRAQNGERRPRLKFTCLIPDGFAIWERAALVVQQQLAEIDVDMSLEAVPYAQFFERMTRGDFEAVLTEMVQGPGINAPYRFWHSPAGAWSWNYFHYQSARTDQALDGVLRAQDPTVFRQGVTAYQQAILEDPPAIFLVWPEWARAVSRRFDVPSAEPDRDVLQMIGQWRPAAARLAH
jgi:peptide/nickel transport system substrate-binding protein